MLCFVGMMYPLHALNLNMLQVSGRSDLFLKLEIIKKMLAIPTIIIGVVWGIKIMLVGMMLNTLIAYYLNSYWSGRFINYSFKQQVIDILPSFGLALVMAVGVFGLGLILPFNPLGLFISQTLAGIAFIILFCETTKFKDYVFVKEQIIEKYREIHKK
jgi:O-antigen/teichoic acid export membrane protein